MRIDMLALTDPRSDRLIELLKMLQPSLTHSAEFFSCTASISALGTARVNLCAIAEKAPKDVPPPNLNCCTPAACDSAGLSALPRNGVWLHPVRANNIMAVACRSGHLAIGRVIGRIPVTSREVAGTLRSN